MEYLLVQDDCALDAREAFERLMFESYNLKVSDFKEKGQKVEDGYEYKGFILESFPEEPYWHLRKA